MKRNLNSYQGSASWDKWLIAVAVLLCTGGDGVQGFGAAPPEGRPTAVSTAAPAALATLPNLEKANWIWNVPQAISEGAADCYFRKTFELSGKPRTAVLLITADNGYDLHVNGALLGGDTGYDAAHWQSVERYDIRELLHKGKNVIGVKGQNLGGPAGLLLAARIEDEHGNLHEIHSDDSWRTTLVEETGWSTAAHADNHWKPAAVLGINGIKPWGKLGLVDRPASAPRPPPPRGKASPALPATVFRSPPEDFAYPAGIVFVQGTVPPSSTPNPQTIWPIHRSRAYLEHDAPAPPVLGRQLVALVPARPDGKLRVLCDAGSGILGAPSVSHDGKTIYFTMAPAGTKFLRIYRIGADGSGLRPLGREGPWHDYEPEPLPDGRIVFSSTRIGSREEYHGNLASALFIMDSEGENIQPLTQHIVADREPRLTANGAIAFIRSDNFLERAKVETHIHQVHLDGTSGIVLMGGDRQAIRYDRSRAAEGNANWLRSYGYGSPAPLPDGRVAAIGTAGVVVTGPATTPRKVPMPFVPFDIAPLPDGRLLCTTPSQDAFGVIDLETGEVARIFQAAVEKVHSVAYLGPRPQPLLTASHVPPTTNHTAEQTGFLLCQNVRVSRQIHADWERIRAVRVYEGRPLAIRPARHPYAHIGVEAIELGTVPLAPDGSFYVQVPADRALAIQLIDGEGRSVINELSWIYVRPGERRSCVGCHAPRAVSPLPMEALAVRANPVDLTLGSRPHRFRGNNAANGGVLNLQLDRFREVASIDLYTFPATSAAAKLSSAKDEKERKEPLLPARQEELQRATQALRSGSTAAKVSAAQRLGILRDRSAAPVLVGALRDPSVEVRVAAALALAACGDRAVVPPLLSALEQAQPLVAQAAHLALEHLTGHTVPFDGFSAEGRRQGAWAWRKWREHHDWPVVEENLIARLNSPAPQTVHLAIEALGHIGGEKARAALRQFLVDHPDGELRTLMAAIRALGHLRDQASVPLLAKLLLPEASADKGKGGGSHELGFTQKPAYLAATAAEALGWIGSPEAQKALLEAFPQLDNFWRYSFQTGDHDWLMGCHSSVVHYRYLEALENLGASELAGIVPHVLRSVPIDTDRGLLLENDTYENLVARLVYRAGLTSVVGETCLALLGEGSAQSHEHWRAAVTTSPPASSCGILCPECRAAHLLSVISVDRRHAAEIRAALARYRAAPDSRKRAWVCFFLARTLGKVRDREAIPLLSESLEKDPAEALLGLIDPPNVFTYRAMTPFYRAAAAHALGAIGDPAAAPLLLRTVADFHNALDVRHSAAQGLALLCRQSCPAEVKTLAPGYPEVSIRRILQRVANGGGP